MSNKLDYDRLSNFVGVTIDRKIKALSMGITSSTGYLRGLVNQSRDYSTESQTHATNSSNSALDAANAAASALIVWNEFTSAYAGLNDADPTRSKTGQSLSVGAIYIRRADGRLRYTTAIDSSGNPQWADATVAADPTSLAAAGVGVFLSLTSTAQQTVRGPVQFQNTLLAPRVTNWGSQQTATAVDVNDRIAAVQTSINNEINRATLAEGNLSSGKVSKTGDTMSSTLTVQAGGDGASFIMTNVGGGRSWRINSWDDGRMRFIDNSAGVERASIRTDGTFYVNNNIVTGGLTTSSEFVINRSDALDATVQIQQNGVTRWRAGRAPGSTRYYIGRYNASGAYLDSPLQILESDGTVYLNQTVVNSNLTVAGALRNNAAGAAILINNSTGNYDPNLQFMHLGVNRWTVGRSFSGASFYINRQSDQGAYIDTPFQIMENNGWVNVGNLQSRGAVQASGSMSAPVFYSTANGTGRGVALGDDVWIGDANIANGMSVRGQGDFNAGFIQFGNSGISLGCNANDGTLRYGSWTVYHTGNMDWSGIQRVVAENLSQVNGYTVWSSGKKECWGQVNIAGNSTVTVSVPYPHSSWINISIGPWVKNSTDAQDNGGILSKNGVVSFVLANWENEAKLMEWRSVGV